MLAAGREHFADINRDPDLNDDDKRRLKEFYLEELIAPKARKLLQKHFSNEFKELDPNRKPYRRQKVWVDPNRHAAESLQLLAKCEGGAFRGRRYTLKQEA